MVTQIAKMKKQGILFLLLLCLVLGVCGCTMDVYYDQRPYDYPGTKWICEDPDIVLIYPKNGERSFSINGATPNSPSDLFPGFGPGDWFAFHSNDMGKDLFLCSCTFSPEKMIAKVEVDELFGGKYLGKTIVFYRTDLQEEP